MVIMFILSDLNIFLKSLAVAKLFIIVQQKGKTINIYMILQAKNRAVH